MAAMSLGSVTGSAMAVVRWRAPGSLAEAWPVPWESSQQLRELQRVAGRARLLLPIVPQPRAYQVQEPRFVRLAS